MIKSPTARRPLWDLLWRGLARTAPRCRTASTHEPSPPGADTLPAARLRDLGFEADQMDGGIDVAKGQHWRHF